MMSEPSGGGGPVIAVLGSVPNGPAAGDPEITVPMGYTATQRRSINIDINGGAYDELNLLGVGYVLEQDTKLHKPPALIDPAMYRCAHTVPAPPFAGRGHCNPDYRVDHEDARRQARRCCRSRWKARAPSSLESMMEAGTLSSEELVKAELYRIALANARRPGHPGDPRHQPGCARGSQGERPAARPRLARRAAGRDPGARRRLDRRLRAADQRRLDRARERLPERRCEARSELEQAGAIILGDTNTTELGGEFGANMPPGYSSLGGQVLLPAGHQQVCRAAPRGARPRRSPPGFAPLAVGMEASTESAQMILPGG